MQKNKSVGTNTHKNPNNHFVRGQYFNLKRKYL